MEEFTSNEERTLAQEDIKTSQVFQSSAYFGSPNSPNAFDFVTSSAVGQTTPTSTSIVQDATNIETTPILSDTLPSYKANSQINNDNHGNDDIELVANSNEDNLSNYSPINAPPGVTPINAPFEIAPISAPSDTIPINALPAVTPINAPSGNTPINTQSEIVPISAPTDITPINAHSEVNALSDIIPINAPPPQERDITEGGNSNPPSASHSLSSLLDNETSLTSPFQLVPPLSIGEEGAESDHTPLSSEDQTPCESVIHLVQPPITTTMDIDPPDGEATSLPVVSQLTSGPSSLPSSLPPSFSSSLPSSLLPSLPPSLPAPVSLITTEREGESTTVDTITNPPLTAPLTVPLTTPLTTPITISSVPPSLSLPHSQMTEQVSTETLPAQLPPAQAPPISAPPISEPSQVIKTETEHYNEHRQQIERQSPEIDRRSQYDDRRGHYDDRRDQYNDDRRGQYDNRRSQYDDDRRGQYNDRRGQYNDRRGQYDDRRGQYEDRSASARTSPIERRRRYDDRYEPRPPRDYYEEDLRPHSRSFYHSRDYYYPPPTHYTSYYDDRDYYYHQSGGRSYWEPEMRRYGGRGYERHPYDDPRINYYNHEYHYSRGYDPRVSYEPRENEIIKKDVKNEQLPITNKEEKEEQPTDNNVVNNDDNNVHVQGPNEHVRYETRHNYDNYESRDQYYSYYDDPYYRDDGYYGYHHAPPLPDSSYGPHPLDYGPYESTHLEAPPTEECRYDDYHDYSGEGGAYKEEVWSSGEPPKEPSPPRRETPEVFPAPHVSVRFSIGGHLVTVAPVRPSPHCNATVHVHNVQPLVDDLTEFVDSTTSYPGPLVISDTPKSSVIKYCANRINSSDSPDDILLWKFLLLLCQQNGVVLPSDISDLLTQDEGESFAGKSPRGVGVGGAGEESGCGLDELRQLLLSGRKKDALDFACTHSLWGHALMLSSRMDDQSRTYVVNRFTASIQTTDPLSTFYTLLLGRVPSVAKPEGLSRAGDWRPHLAMILTNMSSSSSQDMSTITNLGDSLLIKGKVPAAHLCYYWSGVPFGNYGDTINCKYSLLGVDHTSLIKGSYPSSEHLVRSEILEYASGLSKNDIVFPSLQIFKLLHVFRLIEAGLTKKALGYCESISQFVIRSSTNFNATFLHLLRDLSIQLHYTLCPLGVMEVELPTWIVSLLSSTEHLSPSSSYTNTEVEGYHTSNTVNMAPTITTVSHISPVPPTINYPSLPVNNQHETTPTSGFEAPPTQAPPTADYIDSTQPTMDTHQYTGTLEYTNTAVGQYATNTAAGQYATNSTGQYTNTIEEQYTSVEPIATNTALGGQYTSTALGGQYTNTGIGGQYTDTGLGEQYTSTVGQTSTSTGHMTPLIVQENTTPGQWGQWGIAPPIDHTPSTTDTSSVPPLSSHPSNIGLTSNSSHSLINEVAPPTGYSSTSTLIQGPPMAPPTQFNEYQTPTPTHFNEPPPSSEPRPPSSTKEQDIQENRSTNSKDEGNKKNEEKGWLGRLNPFNLIPKGNKQAHLPTDKNPRIVYDKEKKRWVDLDADEKDDAGPVAPPTDSQLKAKDIPEGSTATNMYSNQRGGAKGRLNARSRYVDVTGANKRNNSSAPPPPPLMGGPMSVQPTFFVPSQQQGGEGSNFESIFNAGNETTPTEQPSETPQSSTQQQAPPIHAPPTQTMFTQAPPGQSSFRQTQYLQQAPPTQAPPTQVPPTQVQALPTQVLSTHVQAPPIQAPPTRSNKRTVSESSDVSIGVPDTQQGPEVPVQPQFFNPSAFTSHVLPSNSANSMMLSVDQFPDNVSEASSSVSEFSQEVRQINKQAMGRHRIKPGTRPRHQYPTIPTSNTSNTGGWSAQASGSQPRPPQAPPTTAGTSSSWL